MSERPSLSESFDGDVETARDLTADLRDSSLSPWVQMRTAMAEEGCDPDRAAITEEPVSTGGGRLRTESLCLDGHALRYTLAEQQGEDDDPPLYLVEERFWLGADDFRFWGRELAIAAQVLRDEGGEIDPIDFLCLFVDRINDGFRDGTDGVGERFPALMAQSGLTPMDAVLFAAGQSWGAKPDWGTYALLDKAGRVVVLSTTESGDAGEAAVARTGLSDQQASERFGPFLDAARRVAAGIF